MNKKTTVRMIVPIKPTELDVAKVPFRALSSAKKPARNAAIE